MSKTVLFYYDLASPNAYLANKALVPMAERLSATIEYRPILLGGVFKATGNQAPFMAFANVPAKLAYMQLEIKRFIERHGLSKFKLNPFFPLNTVMLCRGAIAAEMDGDLARYISVGERLVWEDGLKMDDPDVFVQAYTENGFDGAALLAKTQEPSIKEKLIANTSEAVERGVFGVPSFLIDGELYFGKESLPIIEDLLAA